MYNEDQHKLILLKYQSILYFYFDKYDIAYIIIQIVFNILFLHDCNVVKTDSCHVTWHFYHSKRKKNTVIIHLFIAEQDRRIQKYTEDLQ